jgi:hypothetical protein
MCAIVFLAGSEALHPLDVRALSELGIPFRSIFPEDFQQALLYAQRLFTH